VGLSWCCVATCHPSPLVWSSDADLTVRPP
jgi:hypothetical protein